jgi:hypothetical protein
MLCNKKVTHTQTISNAAGCIKYTWKANVANAGITITAPRDGIPKQFYDGRFPSQKMLTSMTNLKFIIE